MNTCRECGETVKLDDDGLCYICWLFSLSDADVDAEIYQPTIQSEFERITGMSAAYSWQLQINERAALNFFKRSKK